MPWALLTLGVVAAASMALAWTTQQRIRQLETTLVKRQQDTQDMAQEARLVARQANETMREMAARAAMQEARLAEVALQRSQVEDLIRSMSRSRDENLLADIESALHLAQQQAALTGNAQPLVAALQTADERLTRAQEPRLDQVRRAVARDIDRIRATHLSDLGTLAIRLDEAIRLVDELPLISQGAANAATRETPRRKPAVGQVQAQAQTQSQAPTTSGRPLASEGAPMSEQLLRWGQHASRVIWQEAQGLIRVTRIDRPEAMLIAPEQGFFLRENLKLRLLNARLNLLSRQTGSATADLQAAQNSLLRYFDASSAKAKLFQSLLQEVSSQSPQIQVPRPDDTLAALTAATGGR